MNRFKIVLLTASLAILTIGLSAISRQQVQAEGGLKVTKYTTPTPMVRSDLISVGPDGNMWFTKVEEKQIVKLSTDGQMTEYTVTPNLQGGRYFDFVGIKILPGPDGNMWFTTEEILGDSDIRSYVNKITPSGTVTSYQFPADTLPVAQQYANKNKTPSGIVGGPDGNIWVTAGKLEDGDNALYSIIAKMDTSGNVLDFFEQTDDSRASSSIINHSDGNLWFLPGNAVKKISTTGQVTRYPLREGLKAFMIHPLEPSSINEDLLFSAVEQSEGESYASYLVKVSPSGQMTEYKIGDNIILASYTQDSLGNIWFTSLDSTSGEGSARLGKMDISGNIEYYDNLIPNATWLYMLTIGPDSNLWATDAKSEAQPSASVYKIELTSKSLPDTPVKTPRTGSVAIIALLISSFSTLLTCLCLALKKYHKPASTR